MKHWMFGALLLSTVVLTACGTDKTTQLSFEEAANLSMYDSNVISQLLLGSDSPYQQDFSLTTQFQWEGGKASLDLSSQTQQDKKAEKAQGTLAFDAQLLAGEETLGASGEISTFVTPQELFLKVQTLHLTGNDPVLAMASLVVQGIQGQWLRLPSSGEQSLFAGTKDYVSTLTTLQTNRDLLIQQWNAPYQGIFSQFTNQPAYQFTLDPDKMKLLFQEVVTAINTFNQHSLALDSITENGETTLSELTNIDIKIPLFEGNLVLLGNDRVAEVVDTFEVSANEMTIVGEYRYSPEGLVLQVRDKETAQDILQIHILQTQKDTYSVDIQLAEMVTLKGTAKIQEKKAEIVLGFDITLEIGSLLFWEMIWEGNALTFPLKGERKQSILPKITFDEPTTEAIDIMDLLGVSNSMDSSIEGAI